MRIKGILALAALLASSAWADSGNARPDERLVEGRDAYERSDYARAASTLEAAATAEPQNAEIQLLLAKTYYEMHQHDAAVTRAERAVVLGPQNSAYHEWLGRTYGEKAAHTSWFSAISLAKKARQEFALAVRLDGSNFSARQALVEFDCSAPGLVGGGEEKAVPEIEEIAALDAAEGYFAAGNCRYQKKDFAAADAEFAKALESDPKSADLIYDIGEYALKRGEPWLLLRVAGAGERVRPPDPRGKFFRAIGWILQKENLQESASLLREYLKTAPVRKDFPKLGEAHCWLGDALESQRDFANAETEYRIAVELEPRDKKAREALNRLGRN